MRVYQVIMDMETLKPLSARFDMEFTAKNGEPIADSEKYRVLASALQPEMGSGGYSIH